MSLNFYKRTYKIYIKKGYSIQTILGLNADCLKFIHRYYLNTLGGPLQLVVVLVSILLTYVVFRFFLFYVCHSDSPIPFMGASIVCVNNLMRPADLVLWFPDKTSICIHPWHQNDLIVLTVPLNPTKLNTSKITTNFHIF